MASSLPPRGALRDRRDANDAALSRACQVRASVPFPAMQRWYPNAEQRGIVMIFRYRTASMPLRAIAYLSSAREGLIMADLDALLATATAFNRVAGVTGVLMFDGTRFLQYIEGPSDGVASVFARISNARSHTGLQVLAQGEVAIRRFPRWAMASQRIDEATAARIIQADWQHRVPESVGMAMLVSAWTGRHGEVEPAAVCLGS